MSATDAVAAVSAADLLLWLPREKVTTDELDHHSDLLGRSATSADIRDLPARRTDDFAGEFPAVLAVSGVS